MRSNCIPSQRSYPKYLRPKAGFWPSDDDDAGNGDEKSDYDENENVGM